MRARLPFILSYYIGRQYLITVVLVLLGLWVVAGLLDGVELIRRAASRQNVPLSIVLELMLFKWPSMLEKLLPYSVLIGGMAALSRLTKSHELVVARSAGVSVWQFMTPALIAMVLLGTVVTTVYNPIASTMFSRFEKLEVKYLTNRASMLAVSSSGLWLRQVEDDSDAEAEHIIHALKISEQGMKLTQVTIFTFDKSGHFIKRIDADNATLESGYWLVQNALITVPGEPATRKAVYVLDTALTVAQIQDSFASPRTLSFWELPGFIKALEQAGFSALRHKLHWYVVSLTPLMMCALAFIGAAFSLRMHRKGGVRLLMVAGVAIGFMLFFISDIVFALGLSGSLPVLLAAWIPTGVMLLVGIATLLHLEDG